MLDVTELVKRHTDGFITFALLRELRNRVTITTKASSDISMKHRNCYSSSSRLV